jgi:hypothetical protein
MPNENAFAGWTEAKSFDKYSHWLYQVYKLCKQIDSAGVRTYRWRAVSADACLTYSSRSDKPSTN